MKISLEQIKKLFDQLLKQEKSREDISNQASLIQEAEDRGELYYDPPDEELRIWKAVLFLQGVDLKDSPNTYLHSIDDIIDFKKTLDQ